MFEVVRGARLISWFLGVATEIELIHRLLADVSDAAEGCFHQLVNGDGKFHAPIPEITDSDV